MKMCAKILLVDVDSKIPNLALMKLSSYYKKQGYEIELQKIGYSYYPHNKYSMIIVDGYEKIFVSIIFKTNKDKITFVGKSKVIIGGVGYSLLEKLEKEIEAEEPDYSIYPDNDISYGFITRGCIRNCKFCVVPQKEGFIHQVNTIDNIVRHKKIKFLDNNILAFDKHIDILKELVDKKIRCQFNQGLDIRLLTEENAKLLSELNYLGEYFFAFDNIKDTDIINNKFKIIKRYITKDWRIKFFLYAHPDMDIVNDILFRIRWCKINKVLPYLMRDINCWNSKNNNLYIDLAADCNQPSIFKKMTFEQFMQKRTKNIKRREQSLLYITTHGC